MDNASQTLHISLLGKFALTYENQPVTSINTARMRSLLAYLLLNRKSPLSRQHTAFVFWPDSTERQARTNLRQLLYHLRSAFPPMGHFLHTDSKNLHWGDDAPGILDVDEFEQIVAKSEKTTEQQNLHSLRASLETAARIYQGHLLPECYQEWIEADRDRLRQQFITVLERLTNLLEKQREYKKALIYARRLLKEDDLQESTYHRLMRLHALDNDRSSALRVYHNCAKILRRELDIEAGKEIRELFERLIKMPAETAVKNRTEPTRLKRKMSLIGRQKEWERLSNAWLSAGEKSANMIWITGEAGIGKTHLAEELFDWVARQGGTTAKTRFYSAEGSLAYAPLVDWLRTAHFRSALTSLDDVWFKEIVRILPELCNDRSGLEKPETMTETWQRQRFFEALAHAILAASQPLLLFIDNLHWCDRETLEWLHYLLHFDNRARLLLLCTVRTEMLNENKPLVSLMLDLNRDGALTQIELNPLDATDSALLASQIAQKELSEEQAELLYRETEGNPLFLVEMTRAGLEQLPDTAMPYPQSASINRLPPKMQAVIQYRLQQLSPQAKKMMELAAAIGRNFTFGVMKQACEQDEESLVQALDELWQQRIIREQGDNEYDFSHEKLRKVAYASISEGRRRLLHHRVANAIENIHAPDLDAVSSQLAVHYEKADLPEKAIHYYELAGSVSQSLYANTEVITYLQRALELVKQLPHPAERETRELSLLLKLCPPLVQRKGYGAKAVHSVCNRVNDLSQKQGIPTHATILRMLAIGKLVGGEFVEAEKLGKLLLKQSDETNQEVVKVEAYYVLGVTNHWQGNYRQARHYLEQGAECCKPDYHQIHITHFAQDPGIICGIRLALVLWHLGYPFRAQVKAKEVLSLAEKGNHPFSLAYALHWFAWLQNLRGDVEATLRHAKNSMAFSEKYQFPYFATQSAFLHGWALFEQGEEAEGIRRMRSGLAHFRATGSQVGIPYYRELLALALVKMGRVEQPLTLLNEALAAAEQRKEHWPEAELYRIKGKILLMTGKKDSHNLAEQLLRKSIEIATRQEAKTFALHAACDLNHLLQRESREAEAEKMFEKIRTWFGQGLSNEDLVEGESLMKQWL